MFRVGETRDLETYNVVKVTMKQQASLIHEVSREYRLTTQLESTE